ncbi:MAG: YIP1 family protein [Anaerolineae bacterium]|nr:YIP1 family protein [Anaerolineae bacterium]
MGELLSLAWDVLRLERRAFARWESGPGLGGALALFFAISFLVAVPEAVVWTRAHLDLWSLCAAHDRLVERAWDQLAYSPFPPDVRRTVTTNLASILELTSRLDSLPRPVGQRTGRILGAMSGVLAAPCRRLGLWLPYTLAVFALAKALGSRAGLPQVLGASALYVLPHLLDPLRLLQGLGPLVVPSTTAWSVAIYLVAVEATIGLDRPRALIALLVPGLVVLTLAAALVSGAILLL